MATASETEKSPAELEDRVWELVEKLRFCMFSSWDGERQRQRPLTAMPDRESGAIHFLVNESGYKTSERVASADKWCRWRDSSGEGHDSYAGVAKEVEKSPSSPSRSWKPARATT